MRFRTLALGITAVGLLAVGTAAPSPAAEIKEFEATIAMPAPVVAYASAGTYGTDAARQTCPEGGAGDGVIYAFFDLEGEYKHFFVSGPDSTLNEGDPSGQGLGTFHDYDLDLHLYDAKCNELDTEGSINDLNGIGNGSVGGKKPARYAAVSYHHGAPNIPILLEASNQKINKK